MTALLLALLSAFPVRVAVMGDRTGSPDDLEFEIAVDAILEMNPDMVLSVGDYVEGYGEPAEALADWERVMPVIDRITRACPFLWVPGNNDIWDGETGEYWRDMTGTEPTRVQELMGITFVVWDSSIPDILTGEHVDEIRDLTSGMSGEEPWIFVTHKPFWFMSYQDTAAVGRFRSLMAERRPLAVIGGHVHLFAAQREDGVLYVSAGPSGSAVPEPDIGTGDFTQVGWMTVWQDSVDYAVLEARGVHPETINTGLEMDLAYRYSQELLDPRPLEQGLESAILGLVPVEEVPRTVELEIDPGTWGIQPLSMEIESFEEEQRLVFTQNPSGSPYPSPVISVSLNYGPRDRQLSFQESWQVLRRANAFRSGVTLDGQASEGEYRLPANTHFADLSGRPSGIPETRFLTASGEDGLCIYMEGAIGEDGTEEMAGFIFAAPEGSMIWLKVHPDGFPEAQILHSDWEMEPLEEGIELCSSVSGDLWRLELSVDYGLLEVVDGHARVHVYRSSGEDFGTWVHPIDLHRSSMGMVWLEGGLSGL